MLNVLEIFLAEALRQALPQNTSIASGPMPSPDAGKVPLVNVAATSLRPLRPGNGEEESKREPAFFTRRLVLKGDGQLLDFTLPDETKGKVIEVESTPCKLARQGDDYWLEPEPEPGDDFWLKPKKRILRFYQAPAGAFTVLLRYALASGYQELSPCRAILEITVWAEQITTADNLLTPCLAAALAAFSGLDRMELARIETAGFSLRLIKPLVDLDALERTPVSGTPLFCSKARLSLRGEWELTLALGVPPEEGIIRTLTGRLSSASSEQPEKEFKIVKEKSKSGK